MNTKFVFIPNWIIQSIQANKGSVYQILDFGYIKNILSPDDLAEFVYFSENAEKILRLDVEAITEKTIIDNQTDDIFASVLTMWTTLGKGAPPTSSDVDKIKNYHAINDCERSLNERLFTTVSFIEASANLGKTYDIHHFDLNVIGVVIYPGAFTPGQSDENRFDLIRTLVLELTRLNSQESVACTLLMRRYIELLSVR